MELQELYIYQQQVTDSLKDNLEKVQVSNHQNHNLYFYHYPKNSSISKTAVIMFFNCRDNLRKVNKLSMVSKKVADKPMIKLERRIT